MSIFNILLGKSKPDKKVVSNKIIGTVVIGKFAALQTFYSEEFSSTYVQGMTYNIRRGNDILPPIVEKWVAQGKVKKL